MIIRTFGALLFILISFVQGAENVDAVHRRSEAACTRSAFFYELRSQLSNKCGLKNALYKAIPHEDIENLKQKIIKQNKSGKAQVGDVLSCLRVYNDLYEQNRDDENNIYFLDAILPVLFEGYDFTQTKIYKDPYGQKAEPRDFLSVGNGNNSYLLSSLIYTHGISIKSFEGYYHKANSDFHFITSILDRVMQTGFIFKKRLIQGLADKNRIFYLKAIFTPPASWIREAQKNILPTVVTFIFCLEQLKKKNPVSFAIPRRLRNALMLPHIIENALAPQVVERCNTVKTNVQETIEVMRKAGYNDCCHEVTNFLYNTLGGWIAQNTDIVGMSQKSLMG